MCLCSSTQTSTKYRVPRPFSRPSEHVGVGWGLWNPGADASQTRDSPSNHRLQCVVGSKPAEAPASTQPRTAHGVPRLERIRLAIILDREIRTALGEKLSRDMGRWGQVTMGITGIVCQLLPTCPGPSEISTE